MKREDVSFLSGGARIAAWLYRPERPGPYPCVVMAHGFAATRELRLDAYAERFRDAGLAALAFDYRHFGASGGEPRRLLSIRRQREDWRAAVAYARALPDVDPDRVALWGTSFSGGHVLAVAAEDARVAALVAQCPFTSGVASVLAANPITALRAAFAALRDLLGALLGRPLHTIQVVGRPGELGAMTSPDAYPGYMAMVPPGSDFRNEVGARIILALALDRPARFGPRVRCPALVQVGERDVITPPGPTIRMAARMPNARLERRPFGHFDFYVGEGFERAVASQAAFLREALEKSP